jgi:hypothetical protein
MNTKLTEALDRIKRKTYTGMTMRYSRLTAAHKRNAVEMLNKVPGGVTTFFATESIDKENRKVVNIGNR